MDKDICTIRIVFPVENDAQAIDIKAKIKELLSGVPNAQLHFAIMTPPPK